MLKLINLKKLTTKTLIGIFIAVSLVTQAGTNKAVADTCEDNNHGHGDNLAASVTLPSGDVITVTQYDPTNPGAKENQLKNLLKDGDTSGDGMTIVYSNGAFNLTQDEADYVVEEIPDIEANCDYDNNANEVVPKLWGIDEDDGQLFVMTNYTDSTMIDYGKLKWNNNGTVEDIDSDMEAMTLDENGDMYIALDRKLTGSGNGATLLKFNIADASTSADNVVEVIGVIGINFDSSSDNVSGLSIDPNTGQLVALLKNNGSSATDKLYIISKFDGSVIQEIGNITGLEESSTNAEDIEHAPDGNLYVTDNADDHTYKVNSLTGAIIEVVDNNQKDGLDSDSVKFEGLGWDFANNRLIGFDDNDESLAKLTLEAGNNYEYYDTSSMGLTDVEGIDFVPTEDGEPKEFLDYNDDGVADTEPTGNDSDGDGLTNDVDPYPSEFTYPD